jgi:hypothetical protein
MIIKLFSVLSKILSNFPFLDSNALLFRRWILSKSIGYPRWRKILKDSNIPDSKSADLKVLIATSIGSHLAAMQMETTLAASLKLRGCNVQVLLCDGVLPGCQMCEPRLFPNTQRFAKYGPSRDLCGHCYEPGKRAYDEIGTIVNSYSEFLTEADFALAERLSKEVSLSKIEDFVMDGIRIGEHAKAGALRFYARASIENEPYADTVVRRYLKAAILTAMSSKKLFEREKYEVAVFHHGIYVPQGIIGEVARQAGVRVVNWNPAYRKDCFIFSHRDTYHHTLMDEPVSEWENIPWDAKHEKIITSYLSSRWQGENDWIRFHENPYFEKDRILSEIGCSLSQPIIGCLTNVMWDAQLHYPANAFTDMVEWLLFTVRYFRDRPDLQLVIRIHPAEIRGAVPTKQPVVDELKKYFPILPTNVFIVPPESNISTYVLSELCDSVIIYGTKTGVELTSVGIPVIVAGEAWIRNKGVTTDATSPESYRQILDSLPINRRLDDLTVNRALKYAYHFFFRRMIPMKIFEKGPGWPPYRFMGKLHDLAPGSDPGLDCVCDGIINATPFIFNQVK